jgi:hypothetical protein
MFTDGCIYWFECKSLVEYMESQLIKKAFKEVHVPNKGWTGLGYLVPRTALEHLIKKKEFLNER